MFRHYALLAIALIASSLQISAQDKPTVVIDNGRHETVVKYAPMETPWNISVQYGKSYAFGDDSWSLKHDRENAQGEAVSITFGRQLSPLFSAQIKGRWLKLHNRINLDVLDAYRNKYPAFFPNDGFYEYNGLALEAEAMFNIANLFPHNTYRLNVYLIGGVGVNTMFGYDENISNWDGSYGFTYHVDTRSHTMPLGSIGGMIDVRICKELSVNLELLGTFTGDNMEGVKYEENYDVYITASIGMTMHF